MATTVRSHRPRWRTETVLNGLALIIAAVAFLIIVRSLPMAGIFAWLEQQVAGLGHWAPIVFVLSFVVVTSFCLPGWPLNVGAGAVFGPFLGGVLSSIASTGAAAVSFVLGRCLARDRVVRRIERHPRLAAVYHAVGKEDYWKVVAAIRLSHSLPFGLQNVLLGVTRVGFVPYVLTTWLITLPGVFFMAYLGHVAGSSFHADAPPEIESEWSWVLRGAGLLVAGGALWYLGRVVYRGIRQHAAIELHQAPVARRDRDETRIRPGIASWTAPTAFLASLLLLVAAIVWHFHAS